MDADKCRISGAGCQFKLLRVDTVLQLIHTNNLTTRHLIPDTYSPTYSVHALHKNVLHLEGVRHAEQRRGAQAKRSAFRLVGKRDAVTLRIGVCQCWRQIRGPSA